MKLRLKPFWVWSDGKWRARFRERMEAEVEGHRIAEETGASSVVVRVGLLRVRFVAGFPKAQEIQGQEIDGP